MNRILLSALSAAALVSLAWPASAQKSKDTLRTFITLPVATVDNYFDPRPEVQFLEEAAYDNLLSYDSKKNDFAPLLAKSWKRTNDTTYEFELRDDVKWSDGEKFTADDVVYMFSWLTDPATKLRFKSNWAFIDKIEKTGPYSVRLTTKQPTPQALAVLTAQSVIFPKHVHEKLDNKELFGAKPVGTGPYRFTQVDKNKGVVAELRPDYPQATNVKRKPTIGRLDVRAVPDTGSQVAELLTGSVDIIRDVPIDQAEELAKDARFKATGVDPIAITYFELDMKGRTGNKPLTDKRVRQAINYAIDTDPILKVAGGNVITLKRPDALCSKAQRGCGYSRPQYKHDPAMAKKLLAEAGYADGFDLEIVARDTGRVTAEAIAGQLRTVGIRASVKLLSFAAYRQYQVDGHQQALVSGWGGGNIPDVASTLGFMFEPGTRDYAGKDEWFNLAGQVGKEMDDAKRRAIMQKLVDDVTDEAYITILTSSPSIWVHDKDLGIVTDNQPFFSYGFTMGELSWKK